MGAQSPDDDRDRSTVAQRLVVSPTARLRRVVVTEGPDAGREFLLDLGAPSRILLGTSEVCDLRLTDPTVSRRHAAFEPQGRRYRLTDLGSTNGTFVDGISVVTAYVRGGETLRCGSTCMSLEVDEAVTPPELPSEIRFGSTLGASVAMRRLYPLCKRLATTRVPVVIEGETGTGKEVLAESLHEAAGSKGSFVVFDCTTVSPNLVEAELFGHERGAFTGATSSRPGVFEEANGGTLLIDEIGDLDLALQAKLLRALDRGEVRRVGGQKWIKVDVRVLAATRRDLDKAVAAGKFRDDLFHRLAVARIELPPLREREGDVALLARQFATEMSAPPDEVEAEVEARFGDYNWPGNVRELRNVVARYVALGDHWHGDAAPASHRAQSTAPGARAHTDDWIEELVASKVPYAVARRKTIEEFERRYVDRILAEHGGNVAQAARASGLALRYFRLVKARRQQKA
jgi:transcriptional regulator with GAF, ATPase, and Fis domain